MEGLVPRSSGLIAALAASLALGAGACASGGSGSGDYDNRPGLYAFEGRVPSSVGRAPLRGTVDVSQDTVVVELEGAHCRPMPGNLQAYGVVCGEETSFSLDRLHPLRRPRAQVVIRIPYTRQVCERYQQTSQGQVCVSWDRRTEYRTERRTVNLLIRPVDTSPFRP